MDLLTLDMIARSDAAGLERAIKSARPHVDCVIVNVDARSDSETRFVADSLADEVWRFDYDDIGMEREAWLFGDKINFAAARNLGRARVKTPWTLVIDTDEFFECTGDLRGYIRSLPGSVNAVAIPVSVEDVVSADPQRIARTEFRWYSRTHNQLDLTGQHVVFDQARVVQRLDLRAESEIDRRHKQRDQAIMDMRTDADAGSLSALYHVAKHFAYDDVPGAVEWVTKFRQATEIHGPAADERAQLAFALACGFVKKNDFVQAEAWAARMLTDGPRIEAFCVLGDIADRCGRRAHALAWYEIACITPLSPTFNVPEAVERRFKRREELSK